MIPRIKLSLLGSTGLLAIMAAVAAGAPPAEDQSQNSTSQIKTLQDEVSQLRTEVKALKDQQKQQSSATTATAQQEQSAGAALAHEAEIRSHLLDFSGTSAGWNDEKGFFIASDDNKFVLSPFILFQTRYNANWRQNEKADGSDDTQNGFEIRRLQLGFDGSVFTPDLTYRIFWQSSSKNGPDLENLMAWVQYRIHDTPWVIGGGQFKDPLYHEQLLGDAAQLSVDRTLADEIIANGEAFSKGVTLRYDDGGALRGEGAFTSGIDNNNDNFQGFPVNSDTFGLAGRIDYKFMGQWKDYDQFSSQGNKEDLLVAGAGFDWTEGGHTNAYRHVIDIQYNPGPLGLFAAYLGQYTSGNTAGRGGDTYDSSIILQGSYMFGAHWEGFGRYSYIHFDGKEFAAGTDSSVQELTAGANYYFYGQRAKFTFDLSYYPKGTPITDIGDDILANPGHGELLFRGQFQLLL